MKDVDLERRRRGAAKANKTQKSAQKSNTGMRVQGEDRYAPKTWQTAIAAMNALDAAWPDTGKWH